MSKEIDDLFSGGGAPVVKFTEIGDSAKGQILDLSTRQMRDFNTGEPLAWPDGNPKMELLMTVQTDQTSADDDGKRRIIAKGHLLTALREAVKTAGVKSPEPGGKVAVKFTGLGTPPKSGMNAPKLFTAAYAPGTLPDAQVDGLFEAPAATPAAKPDAEADLADMLDAV